MNKNEHERIDLLTYKKNSKTSEITGEVLLNYRFT